MSAGKVGAEEVEVRPETTRDDTNIVRERRDKTKKGKTKKGGGRLHTETYEDKKSPSTGRHGNVSNTVMRGAESAASPRLEEKRTETCQNCAHSSAAGGGKVVTRKRVRRHRAG